MNLSFYSYPALATSKKKQWITKALTEFHKTNLSKVSEKQFQQASNLYKQIRSSNSQVFIFAFGGIGASFKTAQSFFALKNKQAILVDSLDPLIIKRISSLNKKELSSCHFVFISKSGQTSEILFYKQLVQKTYSKKKLSLKNRLTLLVQNQNSPLTLWGKKEQAHCVFLEDSLPGRFSFFSLSGCFQFQACGLKIKADSFLSSSIDSQLYSFLHSLFSKKEIFLCFFQTELKALSNWLEMSWSESLFKESMKKPLPLLRVISWSELRHGFIEELVSKKNQACFLALNLKSDSSKQELRALDAKFYKKESAENIKSDQYKLKKLLKLKKISCLFVDVEKEPSAFFELLFLFYQLLFLAGEYAKVDIKTQPWVDYFKK